MEARRRWQTYNCKLGLSTNLRSKQSYESVKAQGLSFLIHCFFFSAEWGKRRTSQLFNSIAKTCLAQFTGCLHSLGLFVCCFVGFGVFVWFVSNSRRTQTLVRASFAFRHDTTWQYSASERVPRCLLEWFSSIHPSRWIIREVDVRPSRCRFVRNILAATSKVVVGSTGMTSFSSRIILDLSFHLSLRDHFWKESAVCLAHLFSGDIETFVTTVQRTDTAVGIDCSRSVTNSTLASIGLFALLLCVLFCTPWPFGFFLAPRC